MRTSGKLNVAATATAAAGLTVEPICRATPEMMLSTPP
jgi:hypothetical protein